MLCLADHTRRMYRRLTRRLTAARSTRWLGAWWHRWLRSRLEVWRLGTALGWQDIITQMLPHNKSFQMAILSNDGEHIVCVSRTTFHRRLPLCLFRWESAVEVLLLLSRGTTVQLLLQLHRQGREVQRKVKPPTWLYWLSPQAYWKNSSSGSLSNLISSHFIWAHSTMKPWKYYFGFNFHPTLPYQRLHQHFLQLQRRHRLPEQRNTWTGSLTREFDLPSMISSRNELLVRFFYSCEQM